MSARRWLLPAVLVVLVAASAVILYRRESTRSAQPIPGMVRQTEIRIAPEISGRLASIEVLPGQHVRTGEVLAVIDNPDLTAALAEARAAVASSAADRANVYSGVRPEQVAIAGAAVQAAEANLVLAQQQNARALSLSSASFLARQQLDESTASLAKAQADLDGKRAQYSAAKAGPTAEERALADARLAMARATAATIAAQIEKLRLVAPTDGTVGVQVAELGEVMVPGKTVVTLELDSQPWFGLTLREDGLKSLTVGSRTSLTLADGRSIEARVTELRPLGEFATWRAARAVGDHDLNSFLMRLDPVGATSGLEPGMTVWLAAQQ